MIRPFLVALAVSILLEALAQGRKGRWSAWARGVATWSGLCWVSSVLLIKGVVLFRFFNPSDPGEFHLIEALETSVVFALCLGGGFASAGFLADAGAARLRAPRWIRHGVVLLSSVPGTFAGFALYAAALWWGQNETPFWAETSSIGRMFNTFALWLVATGAVFVGTVRMLYDLRVEALEDRQRRLEAEATAARLTALEGQIRPHVLFNALSGLAGLIPEDAARAEAMTLALARLLRRSLDRDAAPTVPLADELAFVQDYLNVERYRLGDRLRVRLDADPDVQAVPVPRFVLQPLVENAIKHGAGGRAEAVTVAVSARRLDNRLELAVGDDGPAFPDGWLVGTGLGGVRDRLALLYGNRAALTVETTPKRVTVALPLP